MTAVLEHTVLPPAANVDSALPAIAAILAGDDNPVLVGSDGTHLVLPAEVLHALRDVVAALRNGLAVTIAPHDTVVTTQAAADLLGISRPTLVRLLEAGDIPFTQPGRHRRVMLADLIDYQHRSQQDRRAVLDEMSRDAAQHDTAATVNGFVPTR